MANIKYGWSSITAADRISLRQSDNCIFRVVRYTLAGMKTIIVDITQTPGFALAGEYTEDSSIIGSMPSGEKAARAVIA